MDRGKTTISTLDNIKDNYDEDCGGDDNGGRG
jgi:hypothetical protein